MGTSSRRFGTRLGRRPDGRKLLVVYIVDRHTLLVSSSQRDRLPSKNQTANLKDKLKLWTYVGCLVEEYVSLRNKHE